MFSYKLMSHESCQLNVHVNSSYPQRKEYTLTVTLMSRRYGLVLSNFRIETDFESVASESPNAMK